MKFLGVVVLLLAPALAGSDALLDMQVQEANRFVKAKPEITEWEQSSFAVVDAWERVHGIKNLLSLYNQGVERSQLTPVINRRLHAVISTPRLTTFDDETRHLKAINQLFYDYASLYMQGEISYRYALYGISYTLSSDAKRVAEMVRQKAYRGCSWDEKCPKVWEQ